MSKITILQNATTTQNSVVFKINDAGSAGYYMDSPQLAIYGIAGAATLDLKFKGEDGNFYSTGDLIKAPSIHTLPFSRETILRLDYNAAGGSNIWATVFNGNLFT